MTDTLILQKPDGQQFPGVKANVSSKQILIPDVRLPIEAGDKITRKLPNGLTETFIVDDPGFHEWFSGIEAHFQVKVHRAPPERTMQPAQKNALRLLKEIYERTRNRDNPVDDVARLNIGLTEEEARAAWRYVRDKNLIQTFNLEYAARINGAGIDAIENAQNQPDRPPPGFPSVTYNNVYNTVNVSSMTGSAIQQGGSRATQEQSLSHVFSQEERANFERLLTDLSEHLEEMNLDERQKQKAKTQIITIKTQLNDAEPDAAIITQAGRTLRNITEGAVGSLIATALQSGVWHSIQHLTTILFPK
ncbi:MAG: hypothetical protein ACREBW_04485 [Candidatus Micrarchaeaceae archaeon]